MKVTNLEKIKEKETRISYRTIKLFKSAWYLNMFFANTKHFL